MAEGRSFAAYTVDDFERVRRVCLHVAVVLGDLMDQVTVVGGLVPGLLIDQDALPLDMERHPGTKDLDLGLDVTLLDTQLYATLSERLRRSGFAADRKKTGETVLQRWRTPCGSWDPSAHRPKVTIDFLMPPLSREDRSGSLRHLESDFGAIITPGLQLVARDRHRVRLSTRTLTGDLATREIWAAGPGAFVVLKARAIHCRDEPKDAYDLYYVLLLCRDGIKGVAAALRPLLDDDDAQEALAWLREDFASPDHIGPAQAARFHHSSPDPDLQADVYDLVQRLLTALE